MSSNITFNFQDNKSLLKRKKSDEKIIEIFLESKKVEDIKKLKQKLLISSLECFIYDLKSRILMISYFLVKLLYLIIALFQIYAMNCLLSTNKYKFYGMQIIHSILRGHSNETSDQLGRFINFIFFNCISI